MSDSICNIPNCGNKAPDSEPFCWRHRTRPKWPEHLLGLLERARWFVNDSIETQESQQARELLGEIDEAQKQDALYCFTKTEQAKP